jgi:hypothetical protein
MDPTEPAVRFGEAAVANWFCDMISADYSELAGNQTADIVFLTGYIFAGKRKIPVSKPLYAFSFLWEH